MILYCWHARLYLSRSQAQGHPSHPLRPSFITSSASILYKRSDGTSFQHGGSARCISGRLQVRQTWVGLRRESEDHSQPIEEHGLISDRQWERRKLNERPIYLRSVFLMFAMMQSILHLYYDYDRVPLPITPALEEQISPQTRGLPAWFATRADILGPMFLWDSDNLAKSIPQNIVLRTLVISISAPFIYAIFIRRAAWEWSLMFASLLWDVPASRLSYIPPHYPSLVYRSTTAGLLLVFLWQSSNALFTAHVARQPIKKDQPLSNESKDPSATLLNGLKSKKEIAKVCTCQYN